MGGIGAACQPHILPRRAGQVEHEQALAAHAGFVQNAADVANALRGAAAALQAMAVVALASDHADQVRAGFERLEEMLGLELAGAGEKRLVQRDGPVEARGGTARAVGADEENNGGRGARWLCTGRFAGGDGHDLLHSSRDASVTHRADVSTRQEAGFGDDSPKRVGAGRLRPVPRGADGSR